MNDQVLALFSRYGSTALFAIVTIAAVGVPLPVTLLLIITGSLVSQGAMDIRTAIALASIGSIAGDQAGFAIGKFGGQALVRRYKTLLGSEKKLRELEVRTRKWGAAGIFFSRWLVSPLGPWVNFASGAGAYSWLQFTIWDVIGEIFGAILFIDLGRIFSDRVQEIGSLFGDLSWAVIAVIAAVFLGWKLLARQRVPVRFE